MTTTRRVRHDLTAALAVVDEYLELEGCDLLPRKGRMARRANDAKDALVGLLDQEAGAAALLRRMLDGECETVLDPDVHRAFIAEARLVLGRKARRRP